MLRNPFQQIEVLRKTATNFSSVQNKTLKDFLRIMLVGNNAFYFLNGFVGYRFFFVRRITPDDIYYGRFAGSTQIYTIEGSTLEQEQ